MVLSGSNPVPIGVRGVQDKADQLRLNVGFRKIATIPGFPEFGTPRIDVAIPSQRNQHARFEFTAAICLTFQIPWLEITASDAISREHFAAPIGWLHDANALAIRLIESLRPVFTRPLELQVKRASCSDLLPQSEIAVQKCRLQHRIAAVDRTDHFIKLHGVRFSINRFPRSRTL